VAWPSAGHKDKGEVIVDSITAEEIESWKKRIDGMTQAECVRLRRFAPVGHPVFRSDTPLPAYFKAHFNSLGGMTPEVSKEIGWEP
jgi:hypothetical protein